MGSDVHTSKHVGAVGSVINYHNSESVGLLLYSTKTHGVKIKTNW
jgi:hypothetical protein